MSADSSEVRRIVEAHNTRLMRWYAEGNIDAVAAVFTEDAWQMPPNAPPLVGRDAIHRHWSDAVRWGQWHFTLETQHVEASGGLAVERGKYVLRFSAEPAAPSSLRSFEDSGHYLVHWRHDDDGEWRIAGDAPVSERAAPGPLPSRADALPEDF